MTLQLFINGEEYDFSEKIAFKRHPSNPCTFTFNNVIKKTDNVYPKNVNKIHINQEFSWAEVYEDKKLVFLGIINASGRLSLLPNHIKTSSVQIIDARKWLSLLKPVNLVFFEETPQVICERLVQALNENFIHLGILNFSNNKPIKAYSLVDKTPYQILKEIISPLTNSFLHFTISEEGLFINFKSITDLQDQISPIELNCNDLEFLKKYQIIDIEYENDTDGYANIVNYKSDNIIASKPNVEEVYLSSNKILVLEDVYKIDSNPELTYIYNPKTPDVRILVIIIESKDNKDGRFYDFVFTKGKTQLEVREGLVNTEWVLHIQYYSKRKWSIEVTNPNEIEKISLLSRTNGEVYLSDKFNDLTSSEDLIRKTTHKLDCVSSPRHTLTLTSRQPIWELLDIVTVITNSKELNGEYIVHRVDGTFDANNKIIIGTYTYVLKQTKDLDDYLNLFDNQSYRTNAAYDPSDIIDIEETINDKLVLVSKVLDKEIIIDPSDNMLQNSLQVLLTPGQGYGKYPLMKVR